MSAESPEPPFTSRIVDFDGNAFTGAVERVTVLIEDAARNAFTLVLGNLSSVGPEANDGDPLDREPVLFVPHEDLTREAITDIVAELGQAPRLLGMFAVRQEP